MAATKKKTARSKGDRQTARGPQPPAMPWFEAIEAALPIDVQARFQRLFSAEGAGLNRGERERTLRSMLEHGLEALEHPMFARKPTFAGHGADVAWWSGEEALAEHLVQLRITEMEWVTYARALRTAQTEPRRSDVLAAARVLRLILYAFCAGDSKRLAALGKKAGETLSANVRANRLQGLLPKAALGARSGLWPTVEDAFVDFFDVIAEPGKAAHSQLALPLALRAVAEAILNEDPVEVVVKAAVFSIAYGPYGITEMARAGGVAIGDVHEAQRAALPAVQKVMRSARPRSERMVVELAIKVLQATLRELGMAPSKVRACLSLLQGDLADTVEQALRVTRLR